MVHFTRRKPFGLRHLPGLVNWGCLWEGGDLKPFPEAWKVCLPLGPASCPSELLSNRWGAPWLGPAAQGPALWHQLSPEFATWLSHPAGGWPSAVPARADQAEQVVVKNSRGVRLGPARLPSETRGNLLPRGAVGTETLPPHRAFQRREPLPSGHRFVLCTG